jgi:peptidoglycan/LPS O-acetylase OafA/YrhL
MKVDWLDKWHVNPSANRDYDLIDGIRGIAILLVLMCHFLSINPLHHGPFLLWLACLTTTGAHGVTIFFTLSGFLISWPFWKNKVKGTQKIIPRGYGWRRFYKIYPPLALSVLILTPIYVTLSHSWSYWIPAVQWLCGLPLIIAPNGQLNPVMWSLIVEVQFYIFLPVLFICLKRVPTQNSLVVAFVCLLLAGTVSRLFYDRYDLNNEINPLIKCYFPSHLDSFAFGVLLAGLESYWRGLPKYWGHFGDVGLGLLVIVFMVEASLKFLDIQYGSYQIYIITISVTISAALLLCYIAQPQKRVARFLCTPWLRWCGIISYEWYLFHQPIFFFTKYFFGPAEGHFLEYIAMISTSFFLGLAVAAVVYRYFSLPILQRGRKHHQALPL